MALDDRQGPVFRLPTNHHSPHAIGSIVLLVSGLEAWLNEAISTLSIWDYDLRPLAFEPIEVKYYRLPKQFSGSTIPPRTELDLVNELRHELVHYLPRTITEEGNVPSWFVELHRRRLFLTSQHGDIDFVLGQKLASYRLAYWAWESVAGAVADLLEALGPKAELLRWTASNFGRFRQLTSPCELATYDAEHRLELTIKEASGPAEEAQEAS